MPNISKSLKPYFHDDSIMGRIAKKADEFNYTVYDISLGTGIREGTIWRNLKNNKISSHENIQKIAQFFKVDMDELLTGKKQNNVEEISIIPSKRLKQINLYGSAVCGKAIAEWENSDIKGTIEVDFLKGLDPKNTFAVEAVGMSMAQTILPGWIVFGYRPIGLPTRSHGQKYTRKDLEKVFPAKSLVIASYKTFPGSSQGIIKRISYSSVKDMIIFSSDNSRNFEPIECILSDLYEIFKVYPKYIGELKT